MCPNTLQILLPGKPDFAKGLDRDWTTASSSHSLKNRSKMKLGLIVVSKFLKFPQLFYERKYTDEKTSHRFFSPDFLSFQFLQFSSLHL